MTRKWMRDTVTILAALILSAPAYGQNWGVLTDPAQNRLGESYCMLWYGETEPMMNFTVRDDGAHYIVIAAHELAGTSQGQAALRLPSGETLSIDYNSPQSGAIILSFTRASFEDFLGHFATPGTFTVSVIGQRVDFPAGDVGPMIPTLRQCTDALS